MRWLERRSISTKVALAPALALAGMCVVALLVDQSMFRVARSLDHLENERMPAFEAALRMDAALDSLARLVDRSVIWEGAGFRAEIVAALDQRVLQRMIEVHQLLEQAGQSPLPSERNLAAAITPLFARYERSCMDTLDLKSTGLPTVAGSLTNTEDVFQQIKATLATFVRNERMATAAEFAWAASTGHRIRVLQLGVLALVMALSGLAAWLVVRSIRYLAEHDALTGLKNRSHIETLLDSLLRNTRDRDRSVTLMFIDLDGFKAVNDRWGHAAGDAVLVGAAQRLNALFRRSGEVVARLGGDELVVLVDNARASDPAIDQRARLVVQQLSRPFALPNGEQATIGASVGLASYPQHALNAATLIQAADAAMYAVKKAGKGAHALAVNLVQGDGLAR